jgi:predicted lipid carrier protein YhbT
MARREEDPDTLFFCRRLILEGDTELGLLFKNTLDGLDASAFDWRKLLPAIPRPPGARQG